MSRPCARPRGAEIFGLCSTLPVETAEEGVARPSLPPPSPQLSAEEASAWRREMTDLAREGDPELHARGLLRLARREELAGNLALAVELYSAVEGPPGSEWVRCARLGREAILGQGAFGPRAEFLLRNLVQQAAEPSTLLALGAAGTVFRWTRLAAWSRLAGGGAPGVMTRGWGARSLAGLAGFAAEAPTFTLVARGAGQALGREQDWSAGGLGRDLLSSYLTLGGLKCMGGITGRLGAGVRGPLRPLLQQGGMLAGILLGHRLETLAGLRRPPAGATQLLDSLATLLQFNVAGRLSQGFFGTGLRTWEGRLELQVEAWTQRMAGRDHPPLVPLLVASGTGPAQPWRWTPPRGLLLSEGHEDPGGSPSKASEGIPSQGQGTGRAELPPEPGGEVEPLRDGLSRLEQEIRDYLDGQGGAEARAAFARRTQAEPELKEEVLQTQMFAYLDGQLDPEQRLAFEAELRANPWLEKFMRGISALDKVVEALAPAEPVPAPLAQFRSGPRPPRPSTDSFILFLGDREWLLDFSDRAVFFLTQNRKSRGWSDVLSNLEIRATPPEPSAQERVVALVRSEAGRLWLRPGNLSQDWTPVAPGASEGIDLAPASYRPLGELLTQEMTREWPLHREGLDLLPREHFLALLRELEAVERGQRQQEFAQLRASHRQFTNAGMGRLGEWPPLLRRENPYWDALSGLYPQEAELMARMLWPVLAEADFARQDRAALLLQALAPRLNPERQRLLVDQALDLYFRAPQEGLVWQMMYGGTSHHPLEVLLGPLSESARGHAYRRVRDRVVGEGAAAEIRELFRSYWEEVSAGGRRPAPALAQGGEPVEDSEAETPRFLPAQPEAGRPFDQRATLQEAVPSPSERRTLRAPTALLRRRAQRLLGPRPAAAPGLWRRAWQGLRRLFRGSEQIGPTDQAPPLGWRPRLPFFHWNPAREAYVFRLPRNLERLRLSPEHFEIQDPQIQVREGVVIRCEGGRCFLDLVGEGGGILLRSRALRPGDPIELGPGLRFLFGGWEEG
ncbi:MAG: hypothetical protein U1F66_04470 [bacterium]